MKNLVEKIENKTEAPRVSSVASRVTVMLPGEGSDTPLPCGAL
jgi:hypothetical protein